MSRFKVLAMAAGVYVAIALSATQGEARCPGNTGSLTLRVAKGTFIVVPVQVNGRGPYDFMVDTGAQASSIDEGLAAELHLKPESIAGVLGAATYSRLYVVRIDLRAGAKAVAEATAVIVDKSQLQEVDPKVRGILGGSFLQHFDLLIDNERRLLCLDDSGTLASAVKGDRIMLQQPRGPENNPPFPRPILVAARLSKFEDKTMLLWLDSGTNVPLLFFDRIRLGPRAQRSTLTWKRLVNGVEQYFDMLPPQEVTIGRTILNQVPFAVPVNSIGEGGPAPREDGAMPTIAYRRVFISCSGNYVVLDRWE